jgi:hypothetical protein
MFPGYLFIHHGMEKKSYIEILNARGVVRVLEGGWNRLTPIADDEDGGDSTRRESRCAGVASRYFNRAIASGCSTAAHRPRRASSCVTSRTRVASSCRSISFRPAWQSKSTPRSLRLRMRTGIGVRFVLMGAVAAVSSRFRRWRDRNRA